MYSPKELINIIYDTLMGNSNNKQLDLSSVENQEIDSDRQIIEFDYKGNNVFIVIKVTKIT